MLSNPLARQTYDIENRFNEDLSNDIQDDIYADKLGGRQYYKQRKMSDFYHTKWTGYEKPKWYHPYNGYDVRSQYLYRQRNDDEAWYTAPYEDMARDYVRRNRLIFWIAFFFCADIARWLYFRRDRL